jgi:FkbM family methyltransferase
MKNLLKNLIEKTGYGVVNLKALNAPQKKEQITRKDFFNLYFSKVPKDFFFVEIGASDGVSADPIYPYVSKYNLSGIAVEPLPDSFKRLQKNYEGNEHVTCVNAAIGEKDLPFWSVAENAPSDKNKLNLAQISSFNRESLVRELSKRIPAGQDPEDYIEETRITTLTFKELVEKYDVRKIDFLQLDCEGYDFEVLKQFDFETFSPEVINLESFHFSDETREQCESLLRSKGYSFFRYGGDTCAYKV